MIENRDWKRSVASGLLRLLVLVSLLCPYFTSSIHHAYAPDFILSNMFAFLFILVILLQGKLDWRKQCWIAGLCAIALIGFNAAALYANVVQHHWYSGQINMTTSFMLFLALLCQSKETQREQRTCDFLLKAIILTNAVGLLPFFFGYHRVVFRNDRVYWIEQNPVEESHYAWVYLHKSEYAFMLVVFLALVVAYRHRFPKKWMFFASIAVMMTGLVLANTRTSLLASLFIFVGWLLETIRKQPKRIRYRLCLLFIPLGVLAVVLLYVFSFQRDLLSLGSRTYIWQGAIQFIQENPLGLGQQCGKVPFVIDAWPGTVYNAHNVFLNFLQQFSIPAGLCCIVFFAVIIIVSFVRNKSFLTAGIWVALLLPMNMDWCLLQTQMSMFIVCLYYLFFSPCRRTETSST